MEGAREVLFEEGERKGERMEVGQHESGGGRKWWFKRERERGGMRIG